MHRNRIVEYITSEIAPDISPDEIDANYDLIENGVVDSLAMVRLVAWLGEAFSVPVNEIDVTPNNFSTVNAIQSFIERNIAANSGVNA